jgi:hypothetical protein
MRQLTVCACVLVAPLLLCSDASAQGCDPVYGGYGYAASYYAPSYGYASSYGGYGYGYRYNPGGLGGPYSGLGVRPGLGFGGFGLRR